MGSQLLAIMVNPWLGSAGGYRSGGVCYRVHGIACAICLLLLSMLAVARGAYRAGEVAVLTSSPHTGIMSLMLMIPAALLLLWVASRGMEVPAENRSARARAAGESI
jgi:hypothetical protein